MNDATPFHKRVKTMPAVILVELLQCQNLACNGTVQQPSNSETYEKGPRYNQNLNRAKIFCQSLGDCKGGGGYPKYFRVQEGSEKISE